MYFVPRYIQHSAMASRQYVLLQLVAKILCIAADPHDTVAPNLGNSAILGSQFPETQSGQLMVKASGIHSPRRPVLSKIGSH